VCGVRDVVQLNK